VFFSFFCGSDGNEGNEGTVRGTGQLASKKPGARAGTSGRGT